MKKVVIGCSETGFLLSRKAVEYMREKNGGMPVKLERDSEILVEAVERLGAEAAGKGAKLCILEYDEKKYHAAVGQNENGEEFLQTTPKTPMELRYQRFYEKYIAGRMENRF
ncbi:MAG: hypothetical protein GX234_01590 [Clostridiales bacterium]|nr:hypothetical protein [Clostridiales bacterium]